MLSTSAHVNIQEVPNTVGSHPDQAVIDIKGVMAMSQAAASDAINHGYTFAHWGTGATTRTATICCRARSIGRQSLPLRTGCTSSASSAQGRLVIRGMYPPWERRFRRCSSVALDGDDGVVEYGTAV
jgi:hypothetical protein